MKPVKLVVHQKSFSEECLVINPKEFPYFNIGQILEIYSTETEFSRLLLQVTADGLHEDFQQKEAISIEESIAKTFQLRPYAEININIVELKDVVLDSVEITFKDQYLARSDMWRMKASLVNTCVFLNKKIEFAGIRCQVYEMWAQGERVACGSITEETKLVFRSASSMVYLFIQMSAEMWDFDINGDLYFEKAVNGFLSDLFAKWKKLTCNHDVTIVMFSRTFYEATSIEEFPLHARECLQKDYKGRFYEDFYRVVVQNERFEDWSSTLILLKRLFNEYQKLTLEHHKRPGCKLPHAFNSTSSQGNFLEVLNMSLNVFEKHYLDRSFDRTGQLSVVISPGVGVFDVDRELTNITKQRIIDNGIGSDLVCLGEQPLHAVPLFKFHNKFQNVSPLNDADDYNMPHWINLSFYSSTKHISYSNFVPRIKLPTPLPKAERMKLEAGIKAEKRSRHISQPFNQSLPVVFNYNDYDAQIFKLPAHSSQGKSLTNSLQRPEARRKMTVAGIQTRTKSATVSIQNVARLRKTSMDEMNSSTSSFHIRSEPTLPSSSSSPASSVATTTYYNPFAYMARSPAISIPCKNNAPTTIGNSGSQRRVVIPIKEAYPESNSSQTSRSNQSPRVIVARSDSRVNIPQLKARTHDDKPDSYEEGRINNCSTSRPIVGSAPTSYEHPLMPKQMSNPRRPRALVNPFDPSHVTIKLTSNRRRWTHVFPLGPTGIFMQQHHYQAVPQNTAATILPVSLDGTVQDSLNPTLTALMNKLQHQNSEIHTQQSTPDVKTTVARFHVEKVYSEADKKNASTPLSRSIGGILPSPSSASLATSDVASIRSAQPRATSSLPSGDPQTDKSLTWLWGATGEQEWTPALTTGVDWKSLAIPACLPITTDYFPDKRSLQSFYGISVYTLLPEDIGIDLAQLSRCFREDDMRHQLPPATSQVYWELIYQRLQQSFQVILMDKAHPDYPHTTSSVATQIKTSVPVDGQPQLEHLMSIGRIFHKISLEDSSITVTQYRPRHPFPTINIHYCYRFRAPDNDTYGVSWVDFTAEKIENYKWNSLDHYICQRGLGEYQLEDNMKFWRVRLLLLPGGHPATQKIIAGNNYCDIYDDNPIMADEDEKLLLQKEGFLKFLELINKIRRPTKKVKVQMTKNLSVRRFSLGLNYTQAFGSLQNQLSSSTSLVPYRERVGSTGARMKTTSTKALERVRSEVFSTSGRVSPASELSSSTNSVDATTEELDEFYNSTEVRKLTLLSTFSEIIEAFKSASEGLTFIKQTGLPSMTFISGEAITWIRDHIDGVDTIGQAISLLQKMEDEGLICHASGCKLPIMNGFYLYSFIPSTKDPLKDSECEPSEERDDYDEEMDMFQKEWMEVEIPPTRDPSAKVGSKKMLACEWETELERRQFEAKELNKTLYLKKVNLDLHFPGRQQPGDRVEWGHAKYHSHFTPDTAYEIVLEWMVATGNVIAEVVMGWARKATGMNLHLVPIPSDPFALPFSSKSDPLRGPIFIPLSLQSLPEPASEMLQDEGLSIFQERILKRFGFLMHQEYTQSHERQQQFVHTSGSIFMVILPNRPLSRGDESLAKTFNRKKRKTLTESLPLGSPHEEYITRHFSGLKKSEIMTSNPETRVGFLLSWNYMITKRFKTNATGDENFMRKILADLREFCANKDDRLRNFWDFQLANNLSIEDNDMFLRDES